MNGLFGTPMAGTISGNVFRDVNANGVDNGAGDPGVMGIEVRAFNATGANVTPGGVVTTDVNGDYSLATTDAGNGPYRVEFSNLPAGFQPTPVGTGNGTSVQFTSAPAANINFGINNPATDTATIEIGNRIWNDANRNGVQDPGEVGINGVQVQLYRNATLVGQTTTATINGAAGTYLFNDANVTLNGATGIVAATGTPGANSEYRIVIPNVQGGGKQAALGANLMTMGGVGAAPNVRLNDSDFSPSGNDAVLLINYDDLAGAGFSNHSFDAGFGPMAADLAISKSDFANFYVPGLPITYTIVVTNNGPNDVAGAIVADALAPGITGGNWTCTATAGSSCGAAAGIAPINLNVNLLVNGTATITYIANVSAGYSGNLVNTATVTAPAGVLDPVLGNNSSTDTDAQGVAGTISGTVFNDSNGNGVLNGGEIGVGNVKVTATDNLGNMAMTTSAADGSYSVGPLAGANARVEFTLPTDGSLNYLKQSFAGPTSVQFVSFAGNVTSVNMPFWNPNDYCQNNPTLLTPCYTNGASTNGTVSGEGVLIGLNYNGTGGKTALATAGQIGATWGVAWKRDTKRAFVSSLVRRHSDFGTQGTGGLYAFNVTPAGPSSTASLAWALNLNTLPGINVGSVNRPDLGALTAPNADAPAFAAVGKAGVGDIDMSDDNTLWLVNLRDGNQSLIKIDVSNPAVPSTATNYTLSSIPGVPSCTGGVFRPWGMKFRDDVGYLGGVCSAENSQDRNNLRAYVLSFNPANPAAGFSTVLTFPLLYTKGYATSRISGSTIWFPWLDTYSDAAFRPGIANDCCGALSVARPTPILADIEFDSSGAMILGFGDRAGLQTGANNYRPDGTGLINGNSGGDILRACRVGGAYVLENNGSCGGVISAGAGNGQGPGGGEFYSGDRLGTGIYHPETSIGGLAQLPGINEIALTATDPLNFSSGGVIWLSHSNGEQSRSGFEIFDSSNPGTLGKSTGLGDLEALCDPAPIEIGNRVWRDYNGNGIQDADPNESGLVGITLQLFKNNILVGQATTDGQGNYYFNNSNVNLNGAAGLLPNMAYEIRLDKTQAALVASNYFTLTRPNIDLTLNGDLRDSDAIMVGNNAVISLVTGINGANDHTFDFGFVAGVSIGNTVWNDINNNGQIDPMEKGIDAVRVELFFDADDNGALSGTELTPVAVQLTSSGGYYLFTQKTDLNGIGMNIPLLRGRYFIGIAASNFGPFGQLIDYLSSGTVAGVNGVPVELPIAGNMNTDNDKDNFDDGLAQSAGFYTGGVLSGPLVVDFGTEPVNETTAGMPGATGGNTPGHPNTIDGTVNGAPILDFNSNLTVDFGFYSLRLGNLVWYDRNNNGLRDSGGSEPGIAGVRVALYFDRNNNGVFEPNAGDGPPVNTVTTDPNGLYLFTRLVPGNYFAYLPASNFDFDRPLFRLLSSTVTQPNPNTDIDNDDNGLDDLQPDANGIRANLITLVAGGEPDTAVDTDDVTGNLSLDFGFYGRLNLGNLVWKDFNNNGVRDNFEPGVDGVSVQLYFDRNNNGVFEPNGADAPVYQQTVTLNGGAYNFTNLELGSYWVVLPPSVFQGNGPLAGCFSSTTTAANPNTDIDNDDNGLDDTNPQINGIRTGKIDLAFGTEPDYAVDGDDKNGNLTIDLGFYSPLNLGNLIWKDNNNNGVKDASEPGIDGVTVELIRDANGNNQPDDAVTSTQITANGGLYNFTNLLPGNYFVRIAAINFQSGGMLNGCFSSTITTANPNSDVDNDDNGLDSATPQTNGIVSGLITLLSNSEPPTNIDGDGVNGNLTVDFGFYPPMNLGNLVWKDFNNNGIKDASEPGMDGVTVELYRDTNGNSSFDAGTDQLVSTQVTAGGGLYNFTNLLPGVYLVRIPASNFQSGGALFGCFSSTTTVANPNTDIDNDDNGIDSANPQNNGIVSNGVTLIGNSEPTTDGDGANGNLTVDFGFYSNLKLGNLVWKDNNNNGLKDGSEPGVDGVRVELYTDRNNNGIYEPNGADAPLIAFQITAGGGLYQFTGLLPGKYFVVVAAINFQNGGSLIGCYSSTTTVANPDTDIDNDDNGVDSATPQTTGIASGVVTLIGQSEPDTAVDGDDRNGNETLDFGFYPPLNLGNLIWKDDNNNGLKDANEPGLDGITVELIRDANNNNQPDDAVIATLVTSGGGLYNFTNLPVGNYFVRVAASNFINGGLLTGCLSSTITNPNPNSDVDNDDNGIDNPTPGNGGVASGVVTLSVNGEPTNDGDGSNGNLTVDFGFYPPMNLGNLVWKDYNNNGLKDAGEPGVDGVSVQLIRDANNNNQADDAVIATLTTSGGGFYNFTGLLPGNYFVRIAASNFVGAGMLVGCLSSTVTQANPNTDIDNDDNGVDNPTPANGGITSGVVTLFGFGEPGPQIDGDGPNGNLTVDFGFYAPLSLGNLVWKDLNNNGQKDANEPGVDGITVELIRDTNGNGQPDDAVVTTLTTAGGGLYQFTGLTPGNYFVRVAASNFTGGGALVGCLSSEPTEANPNDDVDNNDDGLNNPTPATGGIVTGLITLLGNTEPTNDGDGANGNNTVDFGFIPLLNLGNLVWKDTNNNGLKDANEPGIGNVTVELIRDVNNNNQADDAVLATTTTSTVAATLGQYGFANLVPGNYFVRVAASNFVLGGTLNGCLSSTTTEANPNADVDNNDNGVDNLNPTTGGIVTGLITLSGHGEPTNDGDGDNGNLTVDFGFFTALSLGNMVWKDLNNDGLLNNNEPGVGGVVVQLYSESNGTPGLQLGGDTLVNTTVTSNLGQYQFTNLVPGDYYVYLPSSNFTGNGFLTGCQSSTVDAPNPNNDVDNDDNGLPGPNGGIVTGVVTLQINTEPTNDGDGANGNQTVDLGFYAPVNLGNLVWKDLNNNGQKDANEPGVDGVTVELIRDTNANGQPDDAVVATQTTAGGGLYNFTGLQPGVYFVRVAASNFIGGGALLGCLSSEPTETNPNADVDNNDDGLNNPTPANGGIVSGAVTLTGHGEPTNDGDGDNGNLTVDFGFIPLMNLGNLIWKDNNNNGIKDANELGMNGVTVQLYRDTNGNNQFDLATDQLTATTTTTGAGANAGQYSFANLPPGNYFIYLPSSNFTGGGALAGCVTSTVDSPNPNDDKDNDDNGLPGPNGGVMTGIITLTGHGEPTNDGDGDNGNLTVDLGFYAPMNLGNLVWKDLNNNGQKDTNEPGVDGVLLELFKDANNNGTFEEASDTLIVTQTTAGGGLYNFTNLTPGVYFVRVAKVNFLFGAVLNGCLSSTVTASNPDNDVDNDDNGLDAVPTVAGTVSNAITLVSGAEPTNDGDGANGNLTLDFGFFTPLTLGNLVWKDNNNNGLRDNGEAGIDGVTVELIRDANNNNLPDDAVVATTTTANGGIYNFANLQPGNYFVRIAATNFQGANALVGCLSSTTTNANPNSDIDNDDNGIDNAAPQTNGIVSGLITLADGTEPAANVDGDGPNGNQTVDFGFYSVLSLGNLVWKDNNNNGLRDNGEPGVDGVLVQLFRDSNNNGTFEAGTDVSVGTVTTAGGGLYQFTNLTPGNYFVQIVASNFMPGNMLFGCLSSTVTSANANTDVDNDDNGIDNPTPSTGGVTSGVVTLASNSEPPANVDGDGINGNQTVDFGFYPPMTLGNLVWRDTDNNGLRDGGEPGVDGVVLLLFRDSNNNGVLDIGTDVSVATTTTAGGGLYQFTNLLPGNYFVQVAAINFTTGKPLFGSLSSTVTNANPNSDIDNDDNGIDNLNPASSGIASGLVTLIGNSEPTNDGDGPNGNQTVDFGFNNTNGGTLSLGNLVWKDLNQNSLKDANEPGIANVTVQLIRDTNNNNLPDDGVIATTTTNAQGIYSFTGLSAATYFVRIAGSNFATGAVLFGCASSPGNNPPNNDRDNDDNGSDSSNPAANPPTSGPVTLTQGGEPTNDGDGPDGNQTVDFGLVTPITVTVIDPATCIGPGSVLQVEAVVLNTSGLTQQDNLGAEIEITLPPILSAVAGSCTSIGGTTGANAGCKITGTNRITWDGSYGSGERVVLRYQVQIANAAQPGNQYCITTVANFDSDNNGTNESQDSVTVCGNVSCQAPGPGTILPGCSVVVYPVYTSGISNPNVSNTRINLTNANPNLSTAVHLFFVDGAICSVSDAYICLTANQTTSFLMSDLDPGVTGYIIAVTVDPNGCPTNFNYLLGDEYVKFDTGHMANLKADCATGVPGGLGACKLGSSTATLNFDGVSYSQFPQTVAVDSIPDRASGNDTMLVLNRIGGDFSNGADKLGAISGLLYNDTENAYSFTFNPASCQFRSILSNNFPRTAPRFETIIGASHTGWMKLSSLNTAITGATLNRNPNSAANANAYNGGHNLQGLTLNASVSITIPVFPPSCQ